MTAYAIFIRERVRDQAVMDAYVEKAKGSGAAFGNTLLALNSDVKTLEGPAADGVILIQFETLAQAEAWYASERYQEAKQLRHLGGDFRVILVEGLQAGSGS